MSEGPKRQPLQLVRNFLSLSGGEVVSKLLTLLTFAFVARVVGPNGFGYLEFASSIVLCAGLLVDQGFGVYGAREIARAPAATPRLVAEVTCVRFLLAAAVYGGLCLLVWQLERPGIVEQLILLYGLHLFLMPLMLQWVFQGHDRMSTVAGLQVLRQGMFAATVFALLRGANDLWVVAAAELVGGAAVVIASLALYRRQFGEHISLRPTFSTRMVREGAIIGLGQLSWSLRLYGATIVMGLIATEQDVGFFGASMRIAIGLNAFVWLYFFNLLPALTRAWNARTAVDPAVDPADGFRRLIGKSVRTSGWLSLGGGVIWVAAAPFVIRLAYGAAFAPAVTAFKVLSGICVLGAIHGNFRFGMIAASHQRFATLSAAIGTVVTLAMIPFIYPRFGVAGAAMSLVAGEGAVLIVSFLFGRRLLSLERPFANLIRPLACSVPILALLWLLPSATHDAVRLVVAVTLLSAAIWMSEPGVRASVRERLSR